jgi:prolyl 4-hydroxylase
MRKNILILLCVFFLSFLGSFLFNWFWNFPKEKLENKFLYEVASSDEPYIQPRMIQGFLSEEECEMLNQEADRLGFEESQVENFVTNSDVRTSKTCWVYPENTPFLEEIYKRVKEIPEIKEMGTKSNLEACQVVKYEEGQQYKAHYDQCTTKSQYCMEQVQRFGGPRKWTLIMYIKDECEGGETFFPNLNLTVKPKKGDAVLFHSLTNDNRKVHPLSYHQGSPVRKGEKRIANVWIRIVE